MLTEHQKKKKKNPVVTAFPTPTSVHEFLQKAILNEYIVHA